MQIYLCSFFQIADEEVKLHLEDYDSLQDQLELLLDGCIGEFPDDDKSEVATYAATIARAHITDQTRNGHTRCVFLAAFLLLSLLKALQAHQGIHYLPHETGSEMGCQGCDMSNTL